MDKLLKKEQCVERLIASGITENAAQRLLKNDIEDDVVDCIYRYAMLYPFFLCDRIIELCADISTKKLKYPVKDIIYLVRVFTAAQISTDDTIAFFMENLQKCEQYDELRKEAYIYVRKNAEMKYSQNTDCCTTDEVEDIVSDLAENITEIINSGFKSISELLQNMDKEYAILSGQCTKLKEECDEKELKIIKMSETIASLEHQLNDKSEDCDTGSINHKDLVSIVKAVKKKKYHLTADIVSACKNGKISCEDIIFFIGNTSDEEEFKDIIKMYIQD